MKEKKFHKILPFLPVRNLRETLDFYKNSFGFYDDWMLGDKDGGIKRDDLRLLFGENPEHLKHINNDEHRLEIVWFVENVDDIYAEFKERKLKIVANHLQDEAWGIREFTVEDINGYLIRISETISKASAEAPEPGE
jgi:uncharacterized glyoxalase superfamily protein PhnB